MSSPNQEPDTDKGEKIKTSAWSVFVSREGLIFQGAVLITAATCILVGLRDNGLSIETRRLILTAGGGMSLIMWMALAHSLWQNKINSFLKLLGYFILVVGPLGILTITADEPISELLFWWNLFVWCIVTIRFSMHQELSINSWEKILLQLSIIWAVSSAMVTIGKLPWFPFSIRTTQRLSAISMLIDLRFFLGILFLIAATGTAIFRALTQERPFLKNLSPWELPIPERKGILLSILPPVIYVLNVLLVVFHAIVELFWKSIQLLVVFFGRIGSHLARLTKKIVNQYPVWLSTGRSILTLFLSVVAFYLIKYSSPTLYSYLSAELWTEQIRYLSILALVWFVILLCVWVITAMITRSNFKSVGDATIMSLGWLLMVHLLGGALVYASCWVGLDIKGYDKIGIFSIILISLIIFGGIQSLYSMRKNQNGNA